MFSPPPHSSIPQLSPAIKRLLVLSLAQGFQPSFSSELPGEPLKLMTTADRGSDLIGLDCGLGKFF